MYHRPNLKFLCMPKEAKVDMAAKATDGEQEKILSESFSDNWKFTEEHSGICNSDIVSLGEDDRSDATSSFRLESVSDTSSRRTMNDSESIAAIMEEVSRCSGMLKAILQRHEQTAQMTSPKRVRKHC